MSRWPSRRCRRPTPGRGTRASTLAAIAALTGLLLGAGAGGGAPPARAADDPDHVLDHVIVDAAWVDRGSAGPPDLLTIAIDDARSATANLTLLRRAGSWAVQAVAQVQLGSAFDGKAPWLVRLGPGRFVVVAGTNDARSTLTPLSVDEAAHGTIRVDRPVETPLDVSAAGVADVDGDGSMKLVIAGTFLGVGDGCHAQALEVRDLDDRLTLRVRANVTTAQGAEVMSMNGASFGQWDDRLGTDLLTQAYECAGPDGRGAERHHLLAIRLADLTRIHDVETTDEDNTFAAPVANTPAVIDVDGDGRNEAVVSTLVDLRVVDPADGWRITATGLDGASLVAALDEPGRAHGTSLVELHAAADAQVTGVGIAHVTRVHGHIQVSDGPIRSTPWASQLELSASAMYLRGAGLRGAPPVLQGDLDGDGCPELVVPLIVIGCDGTKDPEPGPAWVATRPLSLVGGGSDRALLVAEGLDWFPYPSGTVVLSPLATYPDGAWRVAEPTPFVLAEVPMTAGGSGGLPFQANDVPIPTIAQTASQDGTVEVTRPAGTRLLARVIATGGAANLLGDSTVVATPTGFLDTDQVATEWVGPAGRLTATGAIGAGSGTDTERLALADVPNQDRSVADRWTVTVAALDATGTLSIPTQATAFIDREGPSLTVASPVLSAPWPFTATIHGTAEPGSTVSLGTGTSTQVTTGTDGRWDLAVQLAPWPQDVEVVAADAAGNRTRLMTSLIGGVDVRRLPWPAIAVVAVLAAVGLSSLRGGRRSRRPVKPFAVGVDDDATVLEELPSGRIETRD